MVIYSLFYGSFRCIYVLLDRVANFYSGYTFFFCRQFPCFFILTVALLVGMYAAVEGFSFFVVAFYD